MTAEIETWKAIAGHEGRYEVSDHGRVRSLDRTQVIGNGKGGAKTRRLRGRPLTLQTYPNGYIYVHLGRGKAYLVHRLVANAFLENPKGLPEVNHRDLVRDNNRPGNLEWVTSSRNKHHSYESNTRKSHSKKTPVRLKKPGISLSFETELDAARHLGVSQGSIHSARTRRHLCCGYEVSAA